MSNGAAGAQGAQRVSLAQVSLPRLLFALLHQRFTGTVVIQQPPPQMDNRTVWFRGGMPVFTDWVAPEEVLGRVLLAQQVITDDQLLRALEAMAAHGGLLGEHLTAQRILDRPRLLEGLRLQTTRKLLRPFALRAGEAHVTVRDTSDVDADLLPVNVLSLILAGVGASFDQERIAQELGEIARAPVQATTSLPRYRPHFRFRPSDEPVIDGLLHGMRPHELASAGVGPLRAAQLVYTLWACQMLRATGPAEAEAPGPSVAASRPAAPPAAATPPAAASVAPPAAAPRPAPPVAPPVAAPRPASPVAPPTTAPRAATPTPVPGRPSAAPPVASALSFEADAEAEIPRRATLQDMEVVPETKPRRKRQVTLPDPTAGGMSQDDVDASFEEELAALEARIAEGVHAFDLFGIPVTASKRDVRAAWGELSRRFHPDALRSQRRDDLLERVNAVFAALSEAQQTLNDPERREKLKESIEKGEHKAGADGKDATAQAHAVFQSELVAKEADKLLRANRFQRALERYREAATYNADEPDVQAAMAWCEYQVSGKGPTDANRARTRLTSIVQDWPRTARAHYFLGFVITDQGDPSGAIEAFTKAVTIDPRLIDAERQARALKMKLGRPTAPPAAPADKDRKGGLRGLFGKK